MTKHYDVDIPTLTDAWRYIASFKTKQEAIKFVQEKFGADEEGKVCLISEQEYLEDTELET